MYIQYFKIFIDLRWYMFGKRKLHEYIDSYPQNSDNH